MFQKGIFQNRYKLRSTCAMLITTKMILMQKLGYSKPCTYKISEWGQSLNTVLHIVSIQNINNKCLYIILVQKRCYAKLYPISQLCCHDNVTPKTLKD